MDFGTHTEFVLLSVNISTVRPQCLWCEFFSNHSVGPVLQTAHISVPICKQNWTSFNLDNLCAVLGKYYVICRDSKSIERLNKLFYFVIEKMSWLVKKKVAHRSIVGLEWRNFEWMIIAKKSALVHRTKYVIRLPSRQEWIPQISEYSKLTENCHFSSFASYSRTSIISSDTRKFTKK